MAASTSILMYLYRICWAYSELSIGLISYTSSIFSSALYSTLFGMDMFFNDLTSLYIIFNDVFLFEIIGRLLSILSNLYGTFGVGNQEAGFEELSYSEKIELSGYPTDASISTVSIFFCSLISLFNYTTSSMN